LEVTGSDEVALRRRLLFRLLRDFDFDKPVHRYERTVDPVPNKAPASVQNWIEDEFVFNLPSNPAIGAKIAH
jgi:hypothetical protein